MWSRPKRIPKDWNQNAPLPPDAVTHHALDGAEFKAPPDADFNEVYEAGKADGLDPVQIWRNVGHFGRFDFQRDAAGKSYVKGYANASNFAVGVYMNAAGYSLATAIYIGKIYAAITHSSGSIEKKVAWWIRGWNAANSGMYSMKSE